MTSALSVVTGISQFFTNYGCALAVGSAAVFGIINHFNNIQRDYQQRQCDIFCEYLRNMKKINGNSFSKSDAIDRMAHLRHFHRNCDCFSEKK